MKSHQVIFEIAELFVLKYNELFDTRMPAFVQAVWQLIGTMEGSVREDGVRSDLIVYDALLTRLRTGIRPIPALFVRDSQIWPSHSTLLPA